LAPKDGYLHVGPNGAGHFVKMIHNGIEYGMLQAYAEGFEIMNASNYKLDFAKLSHLWNQGSVIRSWILELAEDAFGRNPKLSKVLPVMWMIQGKGDGLLQRPLNGMYQHLLFLFLFLNVCVQEKKNALAQKSLLHFEMNLEGMRSRRRDKS
jgi:hypothetical protein